MLISNQHKAKGFPAGRDLRHGNGAFTLVELILVMTILAVVIAVAAPSLSHFFRGRSQDLEARRFLSLTRYGQSRAVSEGIPMVLWIDAQNAAYGLEQEAGYSDSDSHAVDFDLKDDLRIEVGASETSPLHGRSLPEIRFTPDGGIGPTSPASISIYEGDSEPIMIVQNTNGLSYEIRNQNKNIENAFR